MRTFVLVALVASVSAIKIEWPSVASCGEGTKDAISGDVRACDHNSKNPSMLDGSQISHNHEGYITNPTSADHQYTTNVQTDVDGISSENLMTAEEIVNSWPSVNEQTSALVQLNARPPHKCTEPGHGNPVSCDDDDFNETNSGMLPKDEAGFKPVKVIMGGPLVG